MEHIEKNLSIWKESLLSNILLGDFFARSEVAHKWKATYRSLMVREAALWRTQDLLTQSFILHQQGHGLGARILLRSAFETLASLVHLNQLMQRVLDGSLNFHVFSDKTTVLLTGSRNQEEGAKALNIVTVLEKCDKQYPGLLGIYGDLSESAHPNWEGLCWGYSKVDHDELVTNFSNRWMELYGEGHLDLIDLCMTLFLYEYNDVWASSFEKLEKWIEENDEELEATNDARVEHSNSDETTQS